MTIATELAKKIVSMRYEDLPTEAVEWAKISIIDTIGCAFSGVDDEAPQIVERALTDFMAASARAQPEQRASAA